MLFKEAQKEEELKDRATNWRITADTIEAVLA